MPTLTLHRPQAVAFHLIDAEDQATLTMILYRLLNVTDLSEKEARVLNRRQIELIERLMTPAPPGSNAA
jgi:hypothetical protein